ncbi:D-alanine--D-alanine ligase family protein [Plantactinospora sp. BB1]|uniref:D-alanine--D-alanine ligase family protein n=1 Tax=Plantactinospora sp. BB1 TaxID=2071627 RepID=UPI000D15F976|nr:D-alanine--D-alanine ligase family protein [Plantactinospora sp. BB1]AVT37869.1 D-alanine--D-alanine ligase [Plantactinospora sp. BB1]
MSIRLAVLYGGRSGEHEVSRRSAASILAHLDRDAYRVTRVLVERDGRWQVDGVPVTLSAALRVLTAQDVVFPAMHGPYGEDGNVQSMLDWLGVPYVGNGVFASAAGMDKAVTKKLLGAEGLRVTTGVTLRDGEYLSQAEQQRLGLPVFVKPARAGSSLGVSRVDQWWQLPAALRLAREADPKVLVERAVPGREIDVGVLQYPDGRVEAGPPLEIGVPPSAAFFDHAAKYDGGAVFQIPAPLDAATTRLLQDRALRAFHALGCRGLLRVDFFLPADDLSGNDLADGGSAEPVVNEVNTFPGFTDASQYPRIWARAGIAFPRLLDILIDGARNAAAAR